MKKASPYSFPIQEYKDCEVFVIKTLKWNLQVLTPYHYLENFVSQGILFTNDSFPDAVMSQEQIQKIESLVFHLLELSVKGS